MHATPAQALPPAERRRLIARGLLRALAATTVLVAVYYLAPLDRLNRAVPLQVSFAIALFILLCVTLWWIRLITRATYPVIRAIEALATTAPLFLLLLAAIYFLMAESDPANFSTHGLTRTDALYFTVTIFSTVGFGDITATSQTARILVTTQMIVDLLILVLGVQVFIGAVRIGLKRTTDPNAAPRDRP